jgi:hypothetical protein
MSPPAPLEQTKVVLDRKAADIGGSPTGFGRGQGPAAADVQHAGAISSHLLTDLDGEGLNLLGETRQPVGVSLVAGGLPTARPANNGRTNPPNIRRIRMKTAV